MTSFCAEKIEQSLMWYPAAEYPQYKAVLLGQMDNVPMCSCTACAKMKNEHNDANSAALMKFMHDVGKKVDAWMALEEKRNAQVAKLPHAILQDIDAHDGA